ncbi:MAG: MATE family efflux transporter [Fusicatenibacter sp.]|nr:MATE family efflux transporter [Fusicatenibacter sp.]
MNDQKQNKMAVMPMGALVWNMSLPMMISLLVQSLYNIVDSIFVARLSEQALTATALAYPVQMLMIAVGVGTAVGLNAELSRTLGTGNKEEASRVAVTGILLEVISAAVFMILGFFGSNYLAHMFTSNAEIAEQCGSYLFICTVFCLGNFVCMSYQRLMQSSGKAFLSMTILVAGAVTNLILDPILIFGMLGGPALGIRGAAIATVIGQWVSMGTGFLLQKYCNAELHVTLKNYRMQAQRVRAIYKVGIPTIIMQALNSMMVTAFNAILLPFSSTAVAFFGVYYKLQNFLFMPLNGLGQASIPIVGYNFGAKNKERIREALKIIYPAAIVIAVAGTLIFRIFPGQLLGLFSAGDAMRAIGIPALRVISLSFPVAAVTMITGYFLSGLGDGVTNMVGSFLRQFVPLIPLAWLFAKVGQIEIVWYAIWVSELCGAAYAVFRLYIRLRTMYESRSQKK